MSDQVTQPNAAGSTPTGPAPAAAASNQGPADVLKIIADVEGHLTRLRSAQKSQDDAISTLTARSKALRGAEEELDRHRVALKQQQMQVERDRATLQQERDQFGEQCKRIDEELRRRAAEIEQSHKTFERERGEMASQIEQAKRGFAELEQAKGVWQQNRQQMQEQMQRAQAEIDQRLAECAKAKDEVAAARSQWEKQRQEVQAKLEARGHEFDQQSAALAQRESKLQQERERLAVEQQQSQRQREELQNRTAALEAERADLLKRVDHAERNVGDLVNQIEKSQQELSEQTKQQKKALDKISAMQHREQTLEKALEEAKASVARAEDDSKDLVKLADAERGKVQSKLEAARKEFESAREARDAAMAELESTRKNIAGLARDLKARDEELATKDKHIADVHKKMEMATGKLSEFAAVLSEQTPQLERGASALAMCEEQAEQIDRLTKQLAELQLASDPQEIQRRDARINELTDALRQSRGQNGGDVAVADIEHRNAALEKEVQQLRLDAQNAQIAADEARQQLQSYVDSGAEAQVKDVALAEHAAKVAALSAQLEKQNTVSAQEMEQKLTAQSKKHQQELASAREAEKIASALRQKVADLEAKLARSKVETASAEAAGNDADSEYMTRLRSKAEQITAVADHLRRRRARLERLRRLMHEKRKAAPTAASQGAMQVRAEQLGNIERERQHLQEVRKMLAASEYQMIRRWSRQRAVTTMAGLMLIVAVSAAGTWFGVDHFFPAVRSASVVLEARSRGGSAPLTPEQIDQWTAFHAEMPKDASFQQTMAKRLGERQMKEIARPQAVAAMLARDFSVDSNKPGMVIYSMSGVDADQMTAFLDVMAHTILTESNRDAGKRSDGAVAVATGERKVEGRVHYASLNPAPVHDERMQKALPIFGIVLGSLLALTLMTWLKLSRSKRVFDDENAALFQDTRSAGAAAPAA